MLVAPFDLYENRIELIGEAQTANLQTFRAGDGWFVCNLVANLGQRW